MAQRYERRTVEAAIAAALARGERTQAIHDGLKAGTLDGIPAPVPMARRTFYDYLKRVRKRLTASDEQEPESTFLAELEQRAAGEPTERVEVEVARTPPAPVTIPESVPEVVAESAPEPTPAVSLIERVAGVLGTDLPGYADDVRGYLTGAVDADELVGRLRTLQARFRNDPERNSVLGSAIRELEPPPEPVRRVPTEAERAWARELGRRDRAERAPAATEQELATGYRRGGW